VVRWVWIREGRVGEARGMPRGVGKRKKESARCRWKWWVMGE